MLVVGSVGRIRDCTVTGMLQAAGLAGEWHHSRAHDFFARRRWDPDGLGLVLVDFLVSVFVKLDGPIRLIRLAVDDTLFGRSGRRVWLAHYLHDGAHSPRARVGAPHGATAGSSSCSWSGCLAWVAGRLGLPVVTPPPGRHPAQAQACRRRRLARLHPQGSAARGLHPRPEPRLRHRADRRPSALARWDLRGGGSSPQRRRPVPTAIETEVVDTAPLARYLDTAPLAR
jgi:hypothetical protein